MSRWLKCGCFIQEISPNRHKFNIFFDYIFNNSKFQDKNTLFETLNKIACGLRQKPVCCTLPDILRNIIIYLVKSTNHIPSINYIQQISVVHYFNDTQRAIHCSIGPHNESGKFDYVLGAYWGKSSRLSINLSWNCVQGEFSIELPSLSICSFDSM